MSKRMRERTNDAVSVLVVDDDPDQIAMLATQLEGKGYAVSTAVSGEEALASMGERPVQVALVDWNMPGMDGIELCRRIRLQETTHYTFLIMTTARSGKDCYMQGMEAGADDFLTKPIDPDILEARLRVAARMRVLRARLFDLQSLLPICSYCFKIRDEAGGWQRVDHYLAKRSDAEFTHGICEDCQHRHFP